MKVLSLFLQEFNLIPPERYPTSEQDKLSMMVSMKQYLEEKENERKVNRQDSKLKEKEKKSKGKPKTK